MKIFLILTICLLILLCILIIWMLSNVLRGQNQSNLQKQLENLSKNQREAGRDLSDSVGQSMSLFSDMLSKNQTQSADAQMRQLQQLEERFRTLEGANEQRMEQMRDTMRESLQTIAEQNNRRLEEMRKTVDERLQASLEETMAASFRRVSESLDAVYRGLGEMKSLASDVGGLKKVLANVKTRGIMGEIQLGAILEEILSPEQFERDIATIPASSNRVEYAIRLPGEDGNAVYLPIDAKFPADCYMKLQDAQESGDKAAIEAAGAVLVSRMRGFAKDIRQKYVEPPYTTAFGILFLPFEGLYSEAVTRGLVESLQRDYQITIAGPSTMAAMLNALQMGFRTLAIQKRSDEVWKILGTVKTEFGKFEEILTQTQNRIEQVGKDLDKLVGVRTRAINRSLREVQEFEILPQPCVDNGDSEPKSLPKGE